MILLILGRGLQGIGGGGILPLASRSSPTWSRRANAAATRPIWAGSG